MKNWTAEEKKFFDALKALYLKDDKKISALEQKALDAVSLQLDKPGQSSIENIQNALQTVTADKEDLFRESVLKEHSPEAFMKLHKAPDSISIEGYRREGKRLSSELKADFDEIETDKIISLAKKAGLKHAKSITR